MAGTWENQNKVLPGAYINIRTNEPLSITPGERGVVAILQEMTAGEDGAVYTLTAERGDWPAEATREDKALAAEALKHAKTVLAYKLPESHGASDVATALAALRTVNFNVLCYPYDGASATANKAAITTWIKSMREDEGVKCQAVLANHAADSEGVINVTQGLVASGGASIPVTTVAAWVAGITAGASLVTSNTAVRYEGAIDVSPRMMRTEMEAAVKEGKFIFKADNSQNVTVVYDINSMTTTTSDKGEVFRKNRIVRTLDGVANDVSQIYESNYIGKVNNDQDGRSLLKSALVEYLNALQDMGAILDFAPDDVVIAKGTDTDAVVVDVQIQPIDSVEKIYVTVNLS